MIPTIPTCSVCGQEMVQRNGRNGFFWGHISPNPDGTWCKGKPASLPQPRPQAPQTTKTHGNTQTGTTPPNSNNRLLEAILSDIKAIREILERYEEHFVNSQLGLKPKKDVEIPIISGEEDEL